MRQRPFPPPLSGLKSRKPPALPGKARGKRPVRSGDLPSEKSRPARFLAALRWPHCDAKKGRRRSYFAKLEYGKLSFDRHSAFHQQILDVAQTQGEPKAKPDRLPNDLRREALPAVADFFPPYRASRSADNAVTPERRGNTVVGGGHLGVVAGLHPVAAEIAIDRGLNEQSEGAIQPARASRSTEGPLRVDFRAYGLLIHPRARRQILATARPTKTSPPWRPASRAGANGSP